jgi:hypothetical protein
MIENHEIEETFTVSINGNEKYEMDLDEVPHQGVREKYFDKN